MKHAITADHETAGAAVVPDGPPLVLAIETELGGHYVYDANTNRILKVSVEQYDQVIARLDPASARDRPAGADDVVTPLQRQGLFLPPSTRAYDTSKHRACLQGKIDTSLSQLILEVTERCNLRCTYCVFGAGYRGQRAHGTRDMGMDVARQALDYFYAHNAQAASASVGFYGGEPLLAWPRIQEVVGLLPSYPRGDETHLHMTTNGTLLTKDKFPFLVEHQISLLVSLDGPRDVHDRCRRTANGKGTFGLVTSNLRALQRYAPSFYRDQVSFSTVRTPGVGIGALTEFFSRNPLTRGKEMQVSGLSPGCPDLVRRLTQPPGDASAQQTDDKFLQEFLQDVLHARSEGHRHRVLSGVFGKRFITLHRRPIYGDCSVPCGLNGMCTPGWRKLFVSAEGGLFSCERVRRDWPIGHVSTGLDSDRVFAYLERHREFHRSRCERCWAVRLCGGCQSTLGGPDGIDAERAEEFCEGEREDIAELIELYVRVLERRSKAFDYVEDVTIS